MLNQVQHDIFFVFEICRSRLLDGRRKRQDGDTARSLDRHGDFPLMLGTVSRDPPGNDFSPFGNKITKDPRILIVDAQLLVRAEATDLSSQEGFFLSVPSLSFRFPRSTFLSFHPFLPHSGVPWRSPRHEFFFCLRGSARNVD